MCINIWRQAVKETETNSFHSDIHCEIFQAVEYPFNRDLIQVTAPQIPDKSLTCQISTISLNWSSYAVKRKKREIKSISHDPFNKSILASLLGSDYWNVYTLSNKVFLCFAT